MLQNPWHEHPERLFAALGDETRLNILMLLASERRLCVCHLQELLGKPQSTISRHLGVLMALGLLTQSQKGTARLYALDEALPPFVREILRLTQIEWSTHSTGQQRRALARQIFQQNPQLLADMPDETAQAAIACA